MAHAELSRDPEVHQKKPLDLTYFEKGASSIIERSALARCNVLIIRNKSTLQTICSATFAPFLSCSVFFLFFYDHAMRGTTTTTTCRQHQTTPHHPQRRVTHDVTRHHTTKKKRRTRTRTCTCICSFCTCRCSCTCRCHFLLISHEKT